MQPIKEIPLSHTLIAPKLCHLFCFFKSYLNIVIDYQSPRSFFLPYDPSLIQIKFCQSLRFHSMPKRL